MCAVLVGNSYDESTVLEDDEYAVLSAALKCLRGEDKQAEAIARALMRCPRTETLPGFLADVFDGLDEAAEDTKGLLFIRESDEVFTMKHDAGSEEAKCLSALLRVLRKGGWLSDFLGLWIGNFAEKPMTPLRLMWWLSERAEEFDSDIYHAKKLMREHPELLGLAAAESDPETATKNAAKGTAKSAKGGK